MAYLDESENTDFFSKLWHCPLRRFKRYGRRLFKVFILGIFLSGALDTAVIYLKKLPVVSHFNLLMLHTFLTISLSCVLTFITHQICLRERSRFKLIRVFQASKRRYDDA